jgi:hypothetical protein
VRATSAGEHTGEREGAVIDDPSPEEQKLGWGGLRHRTNSRTLVEFLTPSTSGRSEAIEDPLSVPAHRGDGGKDNERHQVREIGRQLGYNLDVIAHCIALHLFLERRNDVMPVPPPREYIVPGPDDIITRAMLAPAEGLR